MGNEQSKSSVEASRRPTNKLSKPRTNTSNSTTNLLNLKPSGSPIRPNLDPNDGANGHDLISVEAGVQDEVERAARSQKKRRSMFRSKSAQPKSESIQVNNGVDVQFLEKSSIDNWSTRVSNTRESLDQPYHAVPAESRPLAPSARMSLQHVPYAQQQARSSLVDEAHFSQPRQQEAPERVLHIQNGKVEAPEIAYDEEEQLSKPAGGLPERTNSESEMFAPVRRRSLLQHGIATRTSWTENDSRQSLPSQLPLQITQGELQDYYYNPAKPTSSPLASLAALRSELEDTSPGPRTMTPNDLDYGHIGAYKLGTLRITNGTASPAPSFERPATSSGGEKFLNHNGENWGVNQRSHTFSAPQKTIQPSWITPTESPLHQELEGSLKVNTHLPLPEFAAFNFNTKLPTKSQDLANSYMQDIAMSPFSFDDSPPRTPRLEATSKHTAVEDDLFAAEPGTPVLHELYAPRSFDSGYSAEEIYSKKTAKGPQDLDQKPLAKADSGYSSNVSLRSFNLVNAPAVPTKEAPPTPPKESVSRVASSAYSVTSSYSESSEITIRSKRSLPALPAEDLTVPFKETPPFSLKSSKKANEAAHPPRLSHEQEWAAFQTRPHIVVTPHHARQQSMPAVQSMRVDFVPDNRPAGSAESSSGLNSTSKWRREKKRPQSVQPQPQPFTIQAFPKASEPFVVPPVPSEVFRHLEERVDGFPTTLFPNTYFSTNELRRTASKETLGTIFSVGSAEYKEELSLARLQGALPAVPVHATIPEYSTPQPETNRRNTYQPLNPAPPAPVPQRKPRQSLEASSRKVESQQLQQEFEDQITSYDSVASSIGRSPYEIASGAMMKRSLPEDRAKSMTSQLEAEARERFARARSVSQESISTIQRQVSNESITNGYFYPSVTSSPRSNSRPPSAHAKWTGLGARDISPRSAIAPVQQLRPNPVTHEDGRRLSARSQERLRSPPPVAMQTRGHLAARPTPQIVTVPARAPPQPPQHVSPASEQDEWKEHTTFWAERRKSAGEALQGRKSIEFQRPKSTRPAMPQEPQPQKPQSRQTWEPSHQHDTSSLPVSQYDHSYGSYAQNRNDWQQPHYHQQQQQQEEYYDGPSGYSEEPEQEQLPQTLHRRQTSTSEMLILDRFSGGLNYGYEPGAGLGGSAGTRNAGKMASGGRKSVGDSMRYGVDFSDVPVILQIVKV